jgi:hypothetical protein
MFMPVKKARMEKQIWLIIHENEIRDDIYTLEEAANHMAGEGDRVIPYTIRIQD